MRKINSLSGKVKKVPSTQADPNRYEFLDLKNAEPDLGIAAGNNYVLSSDIFGNRSWVDPTTTINNSIDKAFIDSLNVDADTLDNQDGSYYLDFNNFTNIPDPNIEVILTGDISGSANTTLTNLGNGTISINATVADDSHNHTIANIDGLQDALDGKLVADANTVLNILLTVDGAGSGLDADKLDGQEGTYYLDWNNTTNKPDPTIGIDLSGDVTGSGSVTLTDLASGNVNITTTVADDSHNHTVSTITDFDSAVNTAISSTVDKTFVDALNVNADTLDSQDGSYYLDFTNFTNIPDPNIEVILTGDVSGSANATLTDLSSGSISITATVADDSHNHTVSTITDFDSAVNTAISTTVDKSFIDALNVNADTLDSQDGSYYLDWTNTTNKPDPNIEVILSGDVSGSANVTLTDLGNGTISITTTVADDSHNHTIANIDNLQTTLDGKVNTTTTVTAGGGLTGGGALSGNITISHLDTSAEANTNNSDGNVIQNVQIDTYGHVVGFSSTDLDTRYVNTSGDTLTGFLTLHNDPTTNFHAATKQYVDTVAAASLHYHDPVRVESPVNLNASYNNGDSGVGATLTNAGTQAALVIDGVTLSLNDRVLIYQQTNPAHNGIYVVTNVGSVSTNWVLTRSTDADEYSPSNPSAFGQGDAFFVQEGNTGAGELYVMTTTGTITFGTTAIVFSQISSAQIYSATNGVQLNGTVFSHVDTSSQADVGPLSGGNVISAVDLDTYGHVVGLSTRTLTLNDLGFTGDTTADSYVSWNLAVDGVVKDDVTSGENVNFESGIGISLVYSANNNTITINTANVNADTLDSQDSSYYLNFTNFTNIPDPNIEIVLTGDVTGSANTTLTNLGNGTITVTATVQDDSHNHTIANIDGLQDALDGKIAADANTILTTLLTVDGAGSGLDADKLDGQEGTYYLDWTNTTNKPDPNIEVILTGDVTGSANATLTDLSNGTISITATVADDSHNHTVSTITDFDSAVNTAISSTVDKAFIDALNVDADTLDSQDGSYYLNFNNFTNIPDPNIEVILTGDVTGSANATLTDLGNGVISITATVQDDSHNHTIANIDGLQDALDGKLLADANTVLNILLTVDGAGSGLDADKLDGQEGTYYLDWTNTTNKPDPNIEVILTGDVTGSANATLTDLGNGTISITATVADDSHNHTVSTITDFDSAVNTAISSTVDKSFIDALNVDADTLDGINSTSFLRSDVADIKTAGDLTFADNVKAVFGSNTDLSITHSGTFGSITNITGSLELKSPSNINFIADDSTTLATFYNNDRVELRHNDIVRLTTTAAGITVGGTVFADKLDSTTTINAQGGIDIGNSSGVFWRNANNAFDVGGIDYDATAGLRFYTDEDISTPKAVLTAAGRLGIGTSSPTNFVTAALSQNGTTDILISNSDTGTGARATFVAQSHSADLIMTATSAAYTAISPSWADSGVIATTSRTSGGMVFNVLADAPFRFINQTSERVRITAAGNVGIGTDDPLEKLDVRGNIYTTGNLIFEGTTANDFETTLTVVDPTADRSISLPDASGTIAVSVSDTTTATQGALNLDFTLSAAGNISATGSAQGLGTTGTPSFTSVTTTGAITVGTDLVPDTDNTGNVGTSALTFAGGWFTNLTVDSTLDVRGAIDLADSDILRFGSSDDMEIYHNGTNNIIDLTVGNLIIRDDGTAGDPERFTFARAGNFTASGTIKTNYGIIDVDTYRIDASAHSVTGQVYYDNSTHNFVGRVVTGDMTVDNNLDVYNNLGVSNTVTADTVVTSSLQDSSNRTLRILDAAGAVLWGG